MTKRRRSWLLIVPAIAMLMGASAQVGFPGRAADIWSDLAGKRASCTPDGYGDWERLDLAFHSAGVEYELVAPLDGASFPTSGIVLGEYADNSLAVKFVGDRFEEAALKDRDGETQKFVEPELSVEGSSAVLEFTEDVGGGQYDLTATLYFDDVESGEFQASFEIVDDGEARAEDPITCQIES